MEEVADEFGKAETDMFTTKLIFIDLCLQILLFAASLSAMVTSNQTKLIQTLTYSLPAAAKFNYSPAYRYFVVALSLSTLYGILTVIASSWAVANPCSSKKLLKFYLALIAHDVARF